MSARTSRPFAETAALIREHEVGRDARIETPFGRRLISYADLTATGRHLRFVEEWVSRVRPFYANTHTEVSSTGRLMTEMREEARRVIHRGVKAGKDDVVVFVGAGATAAINKLVGILGLRVCESLEPDRGFSRHTPSGERPVVFLGPYEHHSNLLPWLESVAEVVEIGMDAEGAIDLLELKAQLQAHAGRPAKIGSFAAASNVTGVISDVRAITRVLHEAGALAFFDYAAAAPYMPIDMQGTSPEDRIDAVFLSTHKFIGGPEGSGVLVANRSLFRTGTPERPGGGTVDYVAGPTREQVDYVSSLTEREEGGTPAIVNDLRAGAAFLVKEMLGSDRILEHEVSLAARTVERLGAHPRIEVLGPTRLARLAIISLSIDGLHHDLASVLLDHLFGIQNRAGCACAGPYGHGLLGIDRETAFRFRRLVQRGVLGMKPGWVRLSLPHYYSEEDVEFVLSAVEFVADHGLDFVPAYRLGWRDGVWRHESGDLPAVPGLELSVASLEESARGAAADAVPGPLTEAELRAERARYVEEAHRTAAELRARWEAAPPAWNRPTGDAEVDDLVWFRYVHADGSVDSD